MLGSDHPNEVDARLKHATAHKHYSEASMMDERARQIRAETNLATEKAKAEHAENVRRSLANIYPFGKDCSSEICHPYSVAIKEVLWGFAQTEAITPETTRTYENASSQALFNVNNKQVSFLYELPVVPNLASGLPVPFSVKADNMTLSATSQPYWFWPYIHDPNPSHPKHGRATWECRDLMGQTVATRTAEFKEGEYVHFSCNEVSTKFAVAAKKAEKKKGFF